MTLSGIQVVEMAGLAPGPFAGLVLADNGASVIRVDRPSSTSSDLLCRGKKSIAIDVKSPSGLELLKRLITSSDVLIDPFRPGVMEKLGLGPEIFLHEGEGLNPRLIYARIVGFPRTGPHKDMAGHDINYIALSGVLSMMPAGTKPAFPLNLLADFAGGGFTCANGILLALLERHKSGKGQVVNTDMVSGTRYIASFPLLNTITSSPYFSGDPGTNLLDGGSPFYNVYECQDGRWMSVGCLEPPFFKIFIEKFVASVPSPEVLANGWIPLPTVQNDLSQWPVLTTFLTNGFKSKPRDFWANVFDKSDACTLPVLSMDEGNKLAEQVDGSPLPIPHPQILSESRSTEGVPETPKIIVPGENTVEILSKMGLTTELQNKLESQGAFGKGAKL